MRGRLPRVAPLLNRLVDRTGAADIDARHLSDALGLVLACVGSCKKLLIGSSCLVGHSRAASVLGEGIKRLQLWSASFQGPQPKGKRVQRVEC